MAQTMQDLQDALTAQSGKIDGLAAQLVDFATDFNAAIAKLQSDIAAGGDATASVAAVAAMSTKIDAMAASLKTLDTSAEELSGKSTP